MSEMIDPTLSQLPQHLIDAANQGDTGLEDMKGYLTPPRIKVMQASRKDDYKAFDEGSVLVTPTNLVVCPKDGLFVYTPLYIFDQFCVHNPWNMRTTLPMIRDSTFDPQSEIARKCKSFTTEPCPENEAENIKYATHINALIVIHDVPELVNTPVLMSMYLGEWKSGRKLIDLLNVRTSNGTPIYAHKLQAVPVLRKNKQGNDWIGLDFSNPTADYDGSPWVEDATTFEKFKELHNQIKADKESIVIKHDEYDAPSESGVESDTLG